MNKIQIIYIINWNPLANHKFQYRSKEAAPIWFYYLEFCNYRFHTSMLNLLWIWPMFRMSFSRRDLRCTSSSFCSLPLCFLQKWRNRQLSINDGSQLIHRMHQKVSLFLSLRRFELLKSKICEKFTPNFLAIACISFVVTLCRSIHENF